MILRSPRQPLETGTMVKQPQHGSDVYLTINHHLQAIAEEEIAKAVKAAISTSRLGCDDLSYTGEILAWAKYPSLSRPITKIISTIRKRRAYESQSDH